MTDHQNCSAGTAGVTKDKIIVILRAHLKIGGHDAWEGHYYRVAGIEEAATALLATINEPQAVEVPFANMQFMGGDKSEYAVIRADDWRRFTAALSLPRPQSESGK